MSPSVVAAQMQVLNENFSKSPFLFVLKNTRYVVSDTYYRDLSPPADYAVGTLYKQGGPESLMAYWGSKVTGGSYSRFPSLFYKGEDTTGFNPTDGVFIDIDTVPGGRATCCNLGISLTHEIGHWLGLYHTFEGNSCSNSNTGDFVSDTPQQSNATLFECPIGRDSCPDLPGVDPIHNFMDYSNDPCLEEFTAAQMRRMYIVWSLYREKDEVCAYDHSLFELELNLDRYASEVSWELKGPNLLINPVKNGYSNAIDNSFGGKTIVHDICLPNNQVYVFTIFDSQQDGLQAPGSYKLYLNGAIMTQGGGSYGASASYTFSTGAPSPTTKPTLPPTPNPTKAPTRSPTGAPSKLPTSPSPGPTPGPTLGPTSRPTSRPTPIPTPGPTIGPTPLPTLRLTPLPSPGPSPGPTLRPT